MRAAILAIEQAKRKALASIEREEKDKRKNWEAYISRVEHDVAEYDRALAILKWADAERSKLAQMQAQMDLAGRG